MDTPKTLLEAIKFFSDYENCRQFMIAVRWEDGVVRCPHCGSDNVLYMEKSKLYFCRMKHEKSKFSLKVGTIYEDSPIGLDKWLPATWLLSNCRNGISSYELARALGVTQKSAWFMLGRIRLAMKDATDIGKVGGPDGSVEVDESFVGGKMRNMHKGKSRALRMKMLEAKADGYETRVDNKTPVVGIFDRESRQIRAKVIPNVKRETLQREILEAVEFGSKIYTDSAVSYNNLHTQYVHETVNHAVQYVNGQVHTNSLENFWSLMKRNLSGTYVAVEPFHLDRYLDEQVFRFNNSSMNDAGRFKKTMSQIFGKRLTYAELTGKEAGEVF